jgi:hypothetical protein
MGILSMRPSEAVIATLFGEERAMDVADAREYVWNQNANDDPLHAPAEATSFVSLDRQHFRTLFL